MAAGRTAEGIRAIEAAGVGQADRYVRHQGDAALRGGAIATGARADGAGFLVLWYRGNRHVLETFLRHHHTQGLSPRQLAVEELFHPSTFETFKL